MPEPHSTADSTASSSAAASDAAGATLPDGNPLLAVLPVLLAAAAADPWMAAARSGLGQGTSPASASASASASTRSGSEQDEALWWHLAEGTASEVLQLGLGPYPAGMPGGGTDVSVSPAAAGIAAGSAEFTGLLGVLPHLLSASSAAQHAYHPSLCGPAQLALLIRCLAAVAAAEGSPSTARLQACQSVLHLLLCPALAFELQPRHILSSGAQQLAQAAFEAATELLPMLADIGALAAAAEPSGAADLATSDADLATSGADLVTSAADLAAADLAGLAGSCVYLAMNALASTADATWSPAASLLHKGVRRDAVSKQRAIAADHASW